MIGKLIDSLIDITCRLAVCIVLAILSPFIWLVILMTYGRLRRVAQQIAPLPVEPSIFYRVCREILAIIVLPIIVIVGMFATVMFGVKDEEEK